MGHLAPVSAVAFSPDGLFILSGDWNGQVNFWDLTSGALRKTMNTPGSGRIRDLTFSGDGKQLIVRSSELMIFDVTTGELQRQLDASAGEAMSVSPTGSTLASGARSSLRLFELDVPSTRARVDRLLLAKQISVWPMASPNKLLTVDEYEHVRVWDLQVGNVRLLD